ncbi:MAG: bifunctional phosphopantothenoylcysteine decarboxylase/phosphopantothenate--cysteine ligase CoaBC, partial [Lachnospiraceae bacterium]|nr:bifunctional phosphopantothenoylcysteine decarboxylase/phosphopantothenate--cysteine ligase CoaBC [Lachnospiraceae bacterium]
SGSIAAYKIASLASMLAKKQADVTVIMTPNATNFINPITFEALTGNKCLVDTFDRNFQFNVEHVALAKLADVFLAAPASADVIAKAACGIADDMLTTTLLACRCPKIFAPAMNTRMYENPIVQDNIKKLADYGMKVIDPASGYLACGDVGAGKMPEPEMLFEAIVEALTPKDMAGKRLLVTAGPTQEKIDPVRYISNHSTGRMGYAIARQAMLRGADVTLVSGKTSLQPPAGVRFVPIESAADMAQAVKNAASEQDIIIKAAAVADYRPAVVAQEKVKKKDGELSIALERTEDILAWLGAHRREGQFLCGFSMETEHLLENSRAKLEKKNIDMIVANNLRQEGAGFGTDTNVVTILTKEDAVELPLMSKEEVADRLLDMIIKRQN